MSEDLVLKKKNNNKKRKQKKALTLVVQPKQEMLLVPKTRAQRRRVGKINKNMLSLGGRLKEVNLLGNLEKYAAAVKGGKFRNMSEAPVVYATDPLKYLECIISPQLQVCRVPDGDSTPTVLIKSVMVIEPPVWFNGAADDGRFACAFQMNPGSSAQLDYWQNLVVNGQGAWPTDFTLPASFLLQDGNTSSFFPEEQYSSILFDPSTGLYHADGVAGAGIFGAAPTIYPQSTFEPAYSEVALVDSFTGFQPGQYLIDITIKYLAAQNAVAANAATFPLIGNAQFTVIDQATSVGALGGLLEQTVTGLLTVYSSTDGISVQNNQVAIIPDASNITITPSIDHKVVAPLNGGLTELMRPVAMSVLATCMTSDMTNGGTIAIGRLPGDTIDSHFLARTNNQGFSTQNYTDPDALGKQTGCYGPGAFKNGAYCFWAPQGVQDREFRTPADNNEHYFPTIMVSGKYDPGTAQTVGTSTTPVRIIVTRVFEIQTEIPIFEQVRYCGTTAMTEDALALLASYPSSMENSEHVNFLSRVRALAQRALGFYNNNSKWINPLVTGVGSLLLA